MKWKTVTVHFQFVATSKVCGRTIMSFPCEYSYVFEFCFPKDRFFNGIGSQSIQLGAPLYYRRLRKGFKIKKSQGYWISFWWNRKTSIRGDYCWSGRTPKKWLASNKFIRSSLSCGVIDEMVAPHIHRAVSDVLHLPVNAFTDETGRWSPLWRICP